jgi:hypothetical protein
VSSSEPGLAGWLPPYPLGHIRTNKTEEIQEPGAMRSEPGQEDHPGEAGYLESGNKEQSVLWTDLASAQLALEQNSAADFPPFERHEDFRPAGLSAHQRSRVTVRGGLAQIVCRSLPLTLTLTVSLRPKR